MKFDVLLKKYRSHLLILLTLSFSEIYILLPVLRMPTSFLFFHLSMKYFFTLEKEKGRKRVETVTPILYFIFIFIFLDRCQFQVKITFVEEGTCTGDA